MTTKLTMKSSKKFQEFQDGEEDLFSEDANTDIDLEGSSKETVTNATKSSEVVPSEEDMKDEAEKPKDVQGGSDGSVTTTNTTQQKVPEVVPGEEDAKDEDAAKPTDDPAVTETVTAPKTKQVISKKRKQRGKKCTVHDGIGGVHGEKKVTIVVHSDVKKILNTIKDKFYEYSKSVKISMSK